MMGSYTDRAAATIARYRQTAATATDAAALVSPELFPLWSASGVAYKVGDRARHGALLYRCLSAHTSQASWTPDAAPSLWVRMDDPAIAWPDWRQPQGSTDAYAKGAQVTHKAQHWVSNVDANVWEPGVYGWATK